MFLQPCENIIHGKTPLTPKINDNLLQQAQALFKSWFVDFEPFNNQKPSDWSVSTLGNVSIMGAGGDKPQNVSPIKSNLCQYPIYSNGLSEEGLYGFTDKPKIFKESVTVSARGTIGFVCLRHIPYVPIVRLVTLIPKTEIISAKYLYLWLKQFHITGTGTTQQQLTVPDFRKTEILVPSQEIVTLFTATVEPIFEKIWANQNENEKLSSLRDTLLPKLMSGELDVSYIDL
nr:restriction endonuclease subunit S [Butyricicoccus sp. GAM44]